MLQEEDFIVLVLVLGLIAAFIFIGAIYLLSAFVRWVFRINEIVTLLKTIHSAILPRCSISSDDKTSLQLCDGCNKNFDKNLLRKIDSGQLLCPKCAGDLNNNH
ncbi:MAG: hypothetical protein PHY02_06270 [Phycisphaerae bacterium]|nr:hypothetical protein [Phycisphaerae bacterium]